eukprot:315492-Pyramimonas_sp.AAC.1
MSQARRSIMAATLFGSSQPMYTSIASRLPQSPRRAEKMVAARKRDFREETKHSATTALRYSSAPGEHDPRRTTTYFKRTCTIAFLNCRMAPGARKLKANRIENVMNNSMMEYARLEHVDPLWRWHKTCKFRSSALLIAYSTRKFDEAAS